MENEAKENYGYHTLRTLASLSAELLYKKIGSGIDFDIEKIHDKYACHWRGNAIIHSKGDSLMKISYYGADNWHPGEVYFSDFDSKFGETLDNIARIYYTFSDSFFSGIVADTPKGLTFLGRPLDFHETFLEKQGSIYHKAFYSIDSRENEIEEYLSGSEKFMKEGLKPSPAIESGQGGYIIALRYPTEVTDKITEFSEKISKVIPSLTYDENNIHTTIATMDTQNGEWQPNKDTLEKLAQEIKRIGIVRKEYKDEKIIRILRPTVNFGEWKHLDTSYSNDWLINSDAVVLPNQANQFFSYLVQKVGEFPNIENKEIKPTWGTHISVARFKEERGPEELSDLLEVMKEAPQIEASMPTRVDVGYFNLNSKGFELHTAESFSLL